MKHIGAILLAVGAVGCSERSGTTTEPIPPNTDPVVFDDTFGAGVDFQAFLGSRLDALSIDSAVPHDGTSALRVFVPGPDDLSDGTFAGGAFVTPALRDLSGYNALTFWARSSITSTLNTVGFANDNTGNSLYTAEAADIPLTATWSKVIIPIPLPSKLSAEGGLFFFAEGHEGVASHEIWFDQVQFESVSGISAPQPAMDSLTLDGFIGIDVVPEETRTTFTVDSVARTVTHSPRYFTFASSDQTVAIIDDGRVSVVGVGVADVTATLGSTAVTGTLTVNASEPPATAAPAPTVAAADVISVFSDSYTSIGVDSFLSFGGGRVADISVQGNAVKAYTALNFAGIALSGTVDASAMTHVHMDLWLPSGADFKIKLVDFGEDGMFGGAPDSEHELTFTLSSNPPLMLDQWVALDIPLTQFANLVSTAHLAQIIISSASASTVFVDNVYFRR